ncbi:MAG: 30S ribosomal protein S11 [Gammaproteobacteria bacterium]|nr:30S ribosomal protein S11 [Gammaproteobacteria bacterium]
MASKVKRVVDHVRVCIRATFNNTKVTVTDPKGNTLTRESAGTCNYKSSKKSTPYAAQVAATKACQAAKDLFKVETGEVRVWGAGPGRDAALRAACSVIKVISIADVTGVPFNGTDGPSERRQ